MKNKYDTFAKTYFRNSERLYADCGKKSEQSSLQKGNRVNGLSVCQKGNFKDK